MSCVGVRVGKILNTWFYPKEAQNPVKEVRQKNVIQARKKVHKVLRKPRNEEMHLVVKPEQDSWKR